MSIEPNGGPTMESDLTWRKSCWQQARSLAADPAAEAAAPERQPRASFILIGDTALER